MPRARSYEARVSHRTPSTPSFLQPDGNPAFSRKSTGIFLSCSFSPLTAMVLCYQASTGGHALIHSAWATGEFSPCTHCSTALLPLLCSLHRENISLRTMPVPGSLRRLGALPDKSTVQGSLYNIHGPRRSNKTTTQSAHLTLLQTRHNKSPFV